MIRPPLVTDSGVTYYSARDIVLFVSSPFARVKLCRFGFGKDGSLYIHFPYLKEKRGILSRIQDLQQTRHSLRDGGVVVPVAVKYSHHPAGNAGFSLTGLGPLPRNQSFPLATGTGVVCQLHAHLLSGFVWLDEFKQKDVHLGFDFTDQHPFGVRIEVHWWKKADVAANVIESDDRSNRVPPGPRVQAFDRITGKPRYFMFVGQPSGFPMTDHVLVFTVEPAPLPTGIDTPGMLFIGGFSQTDPPTALSFLYPFTGT